jgi:hypothetical protein
MPTQVGIHVFPCWDQQETDGEASPAMTGRVSTARPHACIARPGCPVAQALRPARPAPIALPGGICRAKAFLTAVCQSGCERPKEQPVATAAAAVEPGKAEEAPETPEPKKATDRRKLIILAAPVVLVGVGAGLWFTGVLPHLLGMQHAEATAEQSAPTPIYVDLPELIANLNSNPQRPSYVKVTARLEVTKK